MALEVRTMPGRKKKHPMSQVKARNVSLYLEDWAMVDKVAKDTPGSRSVSAALRYIIREWALFKSAQKGQS